MLDLILLLTPELDSFHLIGESEASFHNNARDELMHNSHLVLPYFIYCNFGLGCPAFSVARR